MHIHAIACTLPNPDYFLLFHPHTDPSKAVWVDQDLQRYLSLQHTVRQAYQNPERSGLTRYERALMCPPEISLEAALQRLVPYLVEAERQTKGGAYLHQIEDQVVTREAVGIGQGPNQLQDLVIVRKAHGLDPTPALLEKLQRPGRRIEVRDADGNLRSVEEYRPGMTLFHQDQAIDIDSLDFRRDPSLVWAVRRAKMTNSLVRQGYLKVLTLPASVPVYLSRDKGGEVIKERARYWS